MDPDLVLPELRTPMARVQVPMPRWLVRAAMRVLPVPRSSTVAVTTVRTPGGVRLRVYVPDAAARVAPAGAGLLWIHGGGLMLGDARQDEALCLSTAHELGLVVVSANYRVAPEHPFPAAHGDVLAGWRWFQQHAGELGVGPGRIAVGGESAGGGLAAALVQRLHDDGGPQPVCQWLFAPMLDDRTAARRELDAVDHPVWSNTKNRKGWSGYLGTEPGASDVPAYASPARREDLTGLPPAFLAWGDIELFAEENQVYADRLTAAGVPVTTDVVAGAPHGFENWAKGTPVAQALIRRAQDWLRAALSSPVIRTSNPHEQSARRSEQTMKAARFDRFGGPEVLEVVDLPDPHAGDGQVRIAVRAAGINASDWKKRQGLMDDELPQTLGYEAAGVVDEVGAGVEGVAVGDRVVGLCPDGAAQAELAVLSDFAPLPPSLGFAEAAALPSTVETAARALDQLGVGPGDLLLVNGASGNVGGAAVQLAVVRGARVIGTASPANHEHLRELGAEPVAYGEGMVERVRALAPDGVDLALDVAGSGVLPELVGLAGGPGNVLTVADFLGAREHGVRFSRGDAGRATYVLGQLGDLVGSGRLTLPTITTFPFADVAAAHQAGESGEVRGKLVLVMD